MFCPKCGAENKDDSIFCEKCGTKLEMGKTSSKSKKRAFWWNKQSKKTKTLIVTAGIILVILIFVSISYSSVFPSASQYQSKAENWKMDLDSATQLGSGKLANPTNSGYADFYDIASGNINDIEEDMKKTNPPKGYEDFHSCLLNEVDNFKMGYQALSMFYKADDDTQLKNAAQYFKEAHKYEDLANQQERNLGF